MSIVPVHTKARFKQIVAQSRSAYRFYLLWQRIWHPRIVADSDRFWMAVRNRHVGRRGFVVGNGPSLGMADLEALSDEICIASNKIYLAFDDVSWRPAYYSVSDWLVWSKIKHEVPKHFRQPLVLSTFGLQTFPPGAIMLRNLGSFSSGSVRFSLDSRVGQYGGFTVTYNNLQTAVHLGLNPIYLIGCDHYYANEETARPNDPLIAHKGPSNHFVPNYRTSGEIVNMAPIEHMNAAFRCAREACEAVGFKILNATRGGYLEVFDRVAFDDILGEPAALAKVSSHASCKDKIDTGV